MRKRQTITAKDCFTNKERYYSETEQSYTMETTNKEIIEKKVYESGEHNKEYASKGVAGTALGIGIGGLALALLNGNGRGLFGIGGSTMPDNVNINTANGGGSSAEAPTAFQAWEKGCDEAIALTNTIWGQKVNTLEQMYAHRETDVAEKFSLWKSQIDADFGLYKTSRDLYDVMNDKVNAASFNLYKEQRDNYDRVMGRISALEKDVAVNSAIRPYQDKLLQGEIAGAYSNAVNYCDRKTCRMLTGVVVLPNDTKTGYPSYCCCSNSGNTSAVTA